MNRICASDFSSSNDAIRLQVAILARTWPDANRFISELDVHGIDIRFGIDGHGFHSEFATSTNDSQGDLATVCYQDSFEHFDEGRKLFDAEQNIAVLHGIAIRGNQRADGAGAFGFDLIHDFHRFDNTKGLSLGNG